MTEPPNGRRPQPGGGCGASQKVSAIGFNFLKDKPPAQRTQTRPRRRRQHRKVLRMYPIKPWESDIP